MGTTLAAKAHLSGAVGCCLVAGTAAVEETDKMSSAVAGELDGWSAALNAAVASEAPVCNTVGYVGDAM